MVAPPPLSRRLVPFLARFILPTILTVALFLSSIFLIVIPAIEKSRIDGKREVMRELTLSVCKALTKLEKEVEIGQITREAAQHEALELIGSQRHGRGLKDYFWVQTVEPKMIFHPHRPDLVGKSLADVTSPDGRKLFNEVVKLVKENGEGYVEYSWQWYDNGGEAAPKVSYVRLFAPWGWIIGTGLYLDDVRDEINAISRNVIQVSLFIVLIATLIMLYIDKASYEAIRSQELAEAALRSSEEKYRILVESATEGVFMVLGGELVYMNSTVAEMLGAPVSAFIGRQLSEVFAENIERPENAQLAALVSGEETDGRFECVIHGEDDASFVVTIAPTAIELGGRSGFMAVVSDISGRKVAENELAAKEELVRTMTEGVNLALFRVRLGENGRFEAANGKFLELFGLDQPQSLADQAFTDFFADDEGLNRLLEKAEDGIFTHAVTNMRRIDGSCFRAALHGTLREYVDGSRRLDGAIEDISAMVEREEKVASLVTTLQEHLLLCGETALHPLRARIEQCDSPEEVAVICAEQPLLVAGLLKSGATPAQLNGLITATADSVRKKFIELAIGRIGAPPVPFAFMVFGSEGRGEQTLHTDQDNAIVYADPSPEAALTVGAYFANLAELVCGWLADAGYSLCKGNNMATNAELCQPLSAWRKYFSSWVFASTEEDLLRAKIFFDFRSGFGDETLVEQLKEHLATVISDNFRFLQFLVRDVLNMEPPVGRFGKLAVEEHGERGRGIDLKKGMVPIVDYARIYALKHDVRESGTIARLDCLLEKGVLTELQHREMVSSYGTLMQLRLKVQVDTLLSGSGNPDNIISLEGMTAVEKRLLTEIFIQAKGYQSSLSYDFNGLSV